MSDSGGMMKKYPRGWMIVKEIKLLYDKYPTKAIYRLSDGSLYGYVRKWGRFHLGNYNNNLPLFLPLG